MENHPRFALSIVLLLAALTTLSAQSLFVPGGAAGIGTSSSDGNVGIGTNAPQARLQVAGNVRQLVAGRVDNELVDASAGIDAKTWGWSLNGALGADTFGLHTRNDAGVFGETALQFNRSGTAITSILMPHGNVGIGTLDPRAPLHVVGGEAMTAGWSRTAVLHGTYPVLGFYGVAGNRWAGIGYDATWAMRFWVDGASSDIPGSGRLAMSIGVGGNVGIGTSNPTHKLSVSGAVRAKEVIVDTGWSDYVFAPDYRLAPLSEVEAHIKAKQHLPGIPSAAEVAEQGVSVGDMQAKLLAKIEELTLHQIQQAKDISALRAENVQLRQSLAALHAHP